MLTRGQEKEAIRNNLKPNTLRYYTQMRMESLEKLPAYHQQ